MTASQHTGSTGAKANRAWRLAINGYGRIGQCVVRALYESGLRQHLQIVAINELSDIDTIAYLTRYDTTHGRFKESVEVLSANQLQIAGDTIDILSQEDPALLPWQTLGLDLVLECTGVIRDRAAAENHLQAGAPRVLFSHPADAAVDATIIYGVNDQLLSGDERIVSNASCTTNCIIPVIKVLHESLGIEAGTITTIHSAMNDQPTIDAYHHQDLRRTRSSMANIVPVDTGLAKGIERILPEMTGRFTATAMRVPTINVSAIDLTVMVGKNTNATEVNELLQAASGNGLRGTLGYTEEPVASTDFNHDDRSAIVDGSQTRVSNNTMVKVLAWFDNEWGFANRMLDVSRHWLEQAHNK